MTKSISPTIKSSNQNKIFLNLRMKDFTFFLISFFSSIILWVPFLFFGMTYVAIGLSIFFIIMVIILCLLIQVEDDVRLYEWIHAGVIFFLRRKDSSMDEKIEKVENNRIFLKNKKKISIFRIIGEDTNFVDDYDFEKFTLTLERYLRNKDYFLFKMDGDIDLETYKNDAAKKLEITKNPNIKKELEKNLKIIHEFNSGLETSTQSKYYIGLINSNIIDQNDLNANNHSLIKSNIKLEFPKQKEFEEVVRKMFFVNNKIVEYKNYVKTVDENNNVVFNRFIELKQL
ncbi:MAG: hypothetical protein ACRCUM_02195, partial [Mycoplasmoidaceae bacterium]